MYYNLIVVEFYFKALFIENVITFVLLKNFKSDFIFAHENYYYFLLVFLNALLSSVLLQLLWK